MRSFLIISFLVFMLSACGGGGGGSSSSSASPGVSTSAQDIDLSFSTQTLILKPLDTARNNLTTTDNTLAISYISSNPNIASINQTGLVTAHVIGQVTITATANVNGQLISSKYQVVINGIQPLFSFETEMLGANIEQVCGNQFNNPATSSHTVDLSYSVSSPEIASVNKEGNVTLKSSGIVAITVASLGTDIYAAASKNYTIKVTKAPQSIHFNENKRQVTLGSTALPMDITSTGITDIRYASTDTSIATIDLEGHITPVSAGITTISAFKSESDCYQAAQASYELDVLKMTREINFEYEEVDIIYGEQPNNPISGNVVDTLKYSTSDTSVASYDNDGKLIIKKSGSVIIIAEIPETDQTDKGEARYILNIAKAEQSTFSIYSPVHSMRFGSAIRFRTIGGKSSAGITYESDSPDVLEISSTGRVEVKRIPESNYATIRAIKGGDSQYNEARLEQRILIKKGLQNFTINGGDEQDIYVNSNKQLSVYVPVGGGDGKLTYRTSNLPALSISSLGIMRGKALGNVYVYVSLEETDYYEELIKSVLIKIIKVDQTLVSDSSSISLKLGATSFNNNVHCSNSSLCDDQNRIIYTSSSSDIASIDEDGNITAHQQGSAVITASKPATRFYNETSLTFNLNVLPEDITIPVQVGYNRSIFKFDSYLNDLIFTTSRSEQCTYLPMSTNCERFATNDVISDQNISTPHVGVYKTGSIRLNLTASTLPLMTDFDPSYTGRTTSGKAWFKGRFWIIGGGATNTLYKDVWSSSDGMNWKLETYNTPFLSRKGHQLVAFRDPSDGREKLWLIGGFVQARGYSSTNVTQSEGDIWNSVDGINWTKVLPASPFKSRGEHLIRVSKDPDTGQEKLWLFGGENRTARTWNKLYDVWSSTNGINWTQETNSFGNALEAVDAAFLQRSNASEPELWLLVKDLNDRDEHILLSSQTGNSWQRTASTKNGSLPGNMIWETAQQIFSSSAITGQDEKLWLMNDSMWSSSDGRNWSMESTQKFSRGDVLTVSENNTKTFWLFNEFKRQLTYKSIDGKNWYYQGAGDVLSPRYKFGSAVLSKKDTQELYLVGGDHLETLNDVWSFDGSNWKLVNNDALAHDFVNHTVVAAVNPYNQKDTLWLFGGKKDGRTNSALYSSENGSAWAKVSDFPRDDEYLDIHLTHIRNIEGSSELLIAVAERYGTRIIISENGKQWRTVTPDIAINLEGSVTLTDRPDGYPGILLKDADDKVFSSLNGENWIEVTSNLPYRVQIVRRVDPIDNIDKLWAFRDTRVWNSFDGITWSLISSDVIISSDENKKIHVLNGQFITIVNNAAKGIPDQIWYSDDGVFWYLKREVQIPD